MNSDIRKILNANRAQKSFYTHTSMITPKGIFSFSHDKLDGFWETYCGSIYKDGNMVVGLNEVSQQYMPILADIDIKINTKNLSEKKIDHAPGFDVKSVGQNIYSDEQLRISVKTYQAAIKKTVKDVKEEDLVCVVLEKPSYLKKYNNETFLSNGFHLHFPRIFLDKNDIKIFILPVAQSCFDKLSLFDNLVERSSGVIDAGIYTNPWLMYGGRKSADSSPYRVTKIFDHETRIITLKDAFQNYLFYDQNQRPIAVEKDLSFYLPRILSIFPYSRKIKTINPCYRAPCFVAKREKREQREYEKADFAESISTISKILPLISPKRAEDYHEWIKIGWIIYNITDGAEEGRDLWKKFSEVSDKYHEAKCDYYWDKMERRNYTLGTLRYLAKQDSPIKYMKLCKENAKTEIKLNLNTGSHYDIAKVLHMLYADEFVCADITNKIWYWFHGHHWERIDSGVFLRNKISEDILRMVEGLKRDEQEKKSKTDDDIEKTMHDKRLKFLDKLHEKIKTAQYKDNIMKEARCVFYDRKFMEKLDCNPNIIAFKNGVYDFIRNEFRDGKPDDFFSKTLPINYNKDLAITDRRVEDVLNFFKYIFPDPELRNYFLDQNSDIFVGGNKKKLIYMWTGNGDNGKSVTQKLFDKMLGKYAIKVPTTLVTGKKPNVGAAWPELARAGNGVRQATMEEPNDDEKINSGIFKNLTGNDTILARDLYEKGRDMQEMTPMFKMNFICNNLPTFQSSDKATWNRIRVVPFESVFVSENLAPDTEEEQMKLKIFPKDEEFDQKIPMMTEALAWYLIYHRKKNLAKYKFSEPEKVRIATEEYKNNNDFVSQFISESFVREKDSMIALDEIYPLYRTWFRENLTGSCPTKKNLKENIIKIWGEPENPGCIWKEYRQYTLEDQINDNEVVVIKEGDMKKYGDNKNPML